MLGDMGSSYGLGHPTYHLRTMSLKRFFGENKQGFCFRKLQISEWKLFLFLLIVQKTPCWHTWRNLMGHGMHWSMTQILGSSLLGDIVSSFDLSISGNLWFTIQISVASPLWWCSERTALWSLWTGGTWWPARTLNSWSTYGLIEIYILY